MKSILISIKIFFLLAMVSAVSAQWRGPDRNGHFPGEGLLSEWPDGGPELLFSVSGIGEGFSSAVEYKGTIYVTGKLDSMDYLTSIGPGGEINWQVPYGRSWIRSFPNSRSSPFLVDDRAYLLGGKGRLVCADALTGKELWAVDVDEDFGADWHNWGLSESPLVVDDLVFCCPAGEQTAMVAFDKETGELVWKTRSIGGQRSYVSPVLYPYEGGRMILGMTSKYFYAVNPANGEILFTFSYYDQARKYRESGAILTNTPLFRGNEIFITTGYDYPAIMFALSEDGHSLTEKWRSDSLDNHHGHVVRVGDYLYGSNWYDNRNGDWVCLDWNTGETKWVEHWHTKGSIIFSDGMLYIYEEKSGNVGLVYPDPSGFDLRGTFQITDGEGPHWAHPAIYDGKLMIRHGDFLKVYDIRK
jgi:outer membrane protein assembly factor BamB